MDAVQDRKRGCMYGLAIGDALGAAVEFRMPGEFAPVTGYRGLGPHGLLAGQWTDDTSMALALAHSISNYWSKEDQLQKYVEWFEQGKYSVNGRCFDIGNTTRYALYAFTDSGRTVADDDPANSGNGSIMRLAPVAIKYLRSLDLGNYLIESSETTHASRQCKAACLALGEILAHLMMGHEKDKTLENMAGLFSTFCFTWDIEHEPLIQNVLDGSYKSGEGIDGSGWVVKSLEAALWAFYTSNSFEETVLKAVNLGNDSDTTGAVAGQLAGAYWGYSGIPQHLIDGLDRKDMIDQYLDPIL